MKNNRGITLISLVVTIIILIILAGVTINLVIGEKGLITTARRDAIKQEKQSIIEDIKLEILEKEIETLGRELTQSEIETILKKYGNINYKDSNIYSLTPFDKDYEILIDEIYEFVEDIEILEYDKDIVMTEGDIKKLELNYTGLAVSKEFVSSNTESVTADSSTGEITAIKTGTSTITVKLTNKTGKTGTITYNVKVVDKVTITEYPESLTIVVGNTDTINLNYTGNIKSKEFTSDNKEVLTVDSSTGLLKGIAVGTATVTVKLINENDVEVTKSCNVTVLAAVAQIGDVYYSSLQNAITAAPDSTATTVTMVANTNESNITIAATKNINLNVNSKTITGNMTNSGTLSLSSGTIVGNGSITISNSGTLTITSMNITNNNRVLNNTGTTTLKSGTLTCNFSGYAHAVVNSKTFTMTGGSIILNELSGATSGIGAALYTSAGTTNVTGGKISASAVAVLARGGSTNITNATITNNRKIYTIMVDTTGYIVLKNSTITNSSGANAIYNARGYGDCKIYSRASNYGITKGGVVGKAIATTNISTGQAQEKITLYNTGETLLSWATWTDSNGQDDLLWEQTSASSGTTHTYTVRKSAHGNQSGTYYVHIYSVANPSTVITTFYGGLKF